MAARIWMYSIVFFVILVLGINANKPKINATKDGKTVIVEGNNNAVSLGNDREIKTALTRIQERLKSLEEKVSLLVSTKPGASVGPKTCKFDFEQGIHWHSWKRTGTVFNNQPTYGDNSGARGSHRANQQGDWWIGGFENRPSKVVRAGTAQGDGPQGTLTSPSFRITGKHISFLIGGGCDIRTVRAELIIGHKVVKSITGACSETMTRKVWDVHAFIGQKARVKLIDFNSHPWGHINFDDLKGDISCV